METLSDLIEVVKGNIEDTKEKIKELEDALEEELFEGAFYKSSNQSKDKNDFYIRYLRTGILIQNNIKEMLINFLGEISSEYVVDDINTKQ